MKFVAILLFIFCLVSLIVVLRTLCMYQWYPSDKVETFVDVPTVDISEHDERVYFDIIDLYRLYLHRDPDEDELKLEFDNINNGRGTIDSLNYKIKHSLEYLRVHDTHDTDPTGKVTAETEQDVEIVKDILKEIMPKAEISDFSMENLLFLVSKFNSMRRDKSAFIEYYKQLPEYADYCEIEKRNRKETEKINTEGPKPVLDQEPVFFSEDIEEEQVEEEEGYVEEEDHKEERHTNITLTSDPVPEQMDDTKSPIDAYIVEERIPEEAEEDANGVVVQDDHQKTTFTLNRPDINKRGSTLTVERHADTPSVQQRPAAEEDDQEDAALFITQNKPPRFLFDDTTCSFYKEFKKLQQTNSLANLRNTRNMDELRFHCDKEA